MIILFYYLNIPKVYNSFNVKFLHFIESINALNRS